MRQACRVVYNNCHFQPGGVSMAVSTAPERHVRRICLGVKTIMTKRAIFVSLLLMFAASAVVAAPLVDGKVKAGKKKSAVCAACHGATGNSASAQFPKLADQSAQYIYDQLKLFKSGARNDAIMSAQAAALGEQDMKDLAVYFAAQEIKPGVVQNLKLAQQGAKIYHGGAPEFDVPACSGCHGPAGLGNPAAAYPRISGQHAEYIFKELEAYRNGERSGYPKAEIMESVTRGLSQEQMKALAAYVSALMPAKPGQQNTDGALLQKAKKPAAADADKAAAKG